MVENTRNQASLCEMEERLSSKMESRFVELAASMQQAIHLEVRDLAPIPVALDWLGWTFQDSMVKE